MPDIVAYNSYKLGHSIIDGGVCQGRYRMDIESRKIIDVQRIIYQKWNPTLRAALKFYCNGTLKGAHDAMADTRPSWRFLKVRLKDMNIKILWMKKAR